MLIWLFVKGYVVLSNGTVTQQKVRLYELILLTVAVKYSQYYTIELQDYACLSALLPFP